MTSFVSFQTFVVQIPNKTQINVMTGCVLCWWVGDRQEVQWNKDNCVPVLFLFLTEIRQTVHCTEFLLIPLNQMAKHYV